MKTLAAVSLLPFLPLVGSLLIACEGTAPDEARADGAPTAATVQGTEAPGADPRASTTATPPGEPLSAACAAFFVALAARKARCGGGRDMLNLDSSVEVRPSALAYCIQQGARTGTGYTPAFYAACNKTLASAACDDDNAIVKACWEPRGALARGMGCATDDQCADGYCKLSVGAKKGSTCGKCDVPVWGDERDACIEDLGKPKQDLKCRPGLACVISTSYGLGYCESAREQTGGAAGETCTLTGVDRCGEGFACIDGTCAPLPVAHVGESCTGSVCEAGSSCIVRDAMKVCVRLAGAGEECDARSFSGKDSRAECSPWLTCSSTHRCVLPALLQCN